MKGLTHDKQSMKANRSVCASAVQALVQPLFVFTKTLHILFHLILSVCVEIVFVLFINYLGSKRMCRGMASLNWMLASLPSRRSEV
jgi:hypothetical protein